MTRKLDSALLWASRGFKIFPLLTNSKFPAITHWQEQATTDKRAIHAWWGDSDLNIGVLTTDHVVLDVDCKNGQFGYESLEGLGISCSTLTVKTPTGGLHLYYDGESCKNRVGFLGPTSGLDIRSKGGFVVAPGSIIDGVPYEILVDAPIELAPEVLRPFMLPPHVNGREDLEYSEDSEASIALAREYLSKAPIAIEFQGGNHRTFITAAHLVRNLGLSEGTAYDLMMDIYNPRCLPPWDESEIATIVYNATAYGVGAIGVATLDYAIGEIPEDTFDLAEEYKERQQAEFVDDDVAYIDPVDVEIEDVGLADTDRIDQNIGKWIPEEELKARPWIYNQLLSRGEVTQMTATGAGGKSSFAMNMAIHGALGLPFMGHKLHDGPFASIIYNAEDSRDEQSRRALAICKFYGFDIKTVSNRVRLLCAEDFGKSLKLTTGEQNQRQDKVIRKFMQLGLSWSVGMIALDPLVSLHEGEENDSGHMNNLMDIIKEIASKADVAIFLAHHSSKSGTGKADDANSSRGSSAIVTNCRINLGLTGMSPDEADEFGIPETDRIRFSRLGGSKINYALRESAQWIKMHSINIKGIGRLGDTKVDSVGVPREHDIKSNLEAAVLRVADILHFTMLSSNTGSLTLSEAVAALRTEEPIIWGNMLDKPAKNRIEGYLRSPVKSTNGGFVRVEGSGVNARVLIDG